MRDIGRKVSSRLVATTTIVLSIIRLTNKSCVGRFPRTLVGVYVFLTNSIETDVQIWIVSGDMRCRRSIIGRLELHTNTTMVDPKKRPLLKK